MESSAPSNISIQSELVKYDKFVNEKLRVDLKATLDLRDKIYDQISEYVKLRKQIQLIQSQDLKELKTRVDVGSNFYVQAKIPDTKYIYVNIGYGFHAEFTLNEALMFIQRKESHLEKLAERHTQEASSIKAHIKMLLEAISELMQLQKVEEQPYREM
ncbi:Prefoldin subunit-domain-containing protein [Paraphysoderma sedebokerense]|nr:Prefoldin subunit-domain-containing protein [Paraphysoderma sedebokerense]